MVKKILLGILGFILLILAVGFAYYRMVLYQEPLISDEDRAAITLMPLPAKLDLNSGVLSLSNGLQIDYVAYSDQKIENATNRLVSRINQKTSLNILNESGPKLTINCHGDTIMPVQQVREDESYSLVITPKSIVLEAPSTYGVLRGLETILQLTSQVAGDWVIPAAEISDQPRFPWRGLMMDVCRHWMPKDVVLRTLDAMATVKMNVFHWHLSEDQGFRVESKVFPKLHELGSNGKYYTRDDIKEVIAYAADRGIRIVPEFDLPGHSKSWQIAYPELSSVSDSLTFGSRNGVAFSPPLDPTKEEVYEFLDQFMGEMAILFPDPYLHIGGDEVNPKYWNENESIRTFMKEHSLNDHHDLQAYFNQRMQKILTKHGKRMLGWDEILHPDLSQDIIVQSWRSHKSLFEAAQKGGTAILSSGLYLDLILPAGKHYSVDPLVLEGAVDIVPDSSNWKMYDLKLDFAGNEMESQLIVFDRDPLNVFGYFAMMENRMAFKDGTLEGNKLQFNFLGPVGEMGYEAEILGDSISGKFSMGLLSFNNHGHKVGGSDIPGTDMPKIEIMKPLTEEEKSRIIGGEACQWAEFVDSANVESRIWPRTAAIAEKLWSPQELTTNTDDMYRRLAVVSDQLTAQGSTHDTQYVKKLKELISPGGFSYLKTLTDILEEVKYHSRMPALLEYDSVYLPHFPLNRIVDVARPESMEARAFNKLVDRFIAEQTPELKAEIQQQLKTWQNNNDLLIPFYNENEKLLDIANISQELATVSNEVIMIIDHSETTISEEQLLEKLSFLESGENGVVVAVVPGLKRIVTEF